jgi:hypothetical protein
VPAARFLAASIATAALALVAGCAVPRVAVEAQESFDSSATYSRTYAAVEAQTCEAARRALLSQGYVIAIATSEQVRGRKSFQPAPEAHAEVEFTVVCAKEGFAGRRTIAFVNAVQENYSLRKSNNSASVGLSPFGSLSLPFTGSDESLVKVASATVTSADFYERFFQLVERYLTGDPGQLIMPDASVLAPPLAASAPSAAASGPGARAAP